jgi:hypothetical protein
MQAAAVFGRRRQLDSNVCILPKITGATMEQYLFSIQCEALGSNPENGHTIDRMRFSRKWEFSRETARKVYCRFQRFSDTGRFIF